MPERVTTRVIRESKGVRRLSCLTAYDVSFARVFDRAGIDLLLVGDSAANTMLGYETTIPMTMDEMVMLASAVNRGASRALVVADMPFLSYQVSASEAVRNAGRLLKESGVQGVKLEGGEAFAATVKALTSAGIPVMGHLGLKPQSEHQYGTRRVLEAKTAVAAERLLDDAKLLEEAGVFSLVLEKVPWQVARRVTEAVGVPTIGIGAGPHCDGQVLIFHDLLGLGDHLSARFCPQYANLNEIATDAVHRWINDVQNGQFPQLEQSFSMRPEELEKLDADDPPAA